MQQYKNSNNTMESENHIKNGMIFKKLLLLFMTICLSVTLQAQQASKSDSKKILITDVGYISIPNELELQSGNYKNYAESRQKLMAQKFNYEIPDQRIVFQQKELNELTEKGLSSYVRVIIETTLGSRGEFFKQSDDYSMSATEKKEIDLVYKQQIEQMFRWSNVRVIKWDGVMVVNINQSKAIKISYTRQLNDNPYVCVDMYVFHNNDRMHTILIEYQQKDSNKWKPLLDKVINSFHLTNIK